MRMCYHVFLVLERIVTMLVFKVRIYNIYLTIPFLSILKNFKGKHKYTLFLGMCYLLCSLVGQVIFNVKIAMVWIV